MPLPLAMVPPVTLPPLHAELVYNHTVYRWFQNPWCCGTQPRKRSVSKKAGPGVVRQIGQQVRRLRLDLDLTQDELAEKAGMNPKHLGRIELGKSEPGAEKLLQLARALSVPIGELFGAANPAENASPRISLADVQTISKGLADLTATVDRLLAGQSRILPLRAARRPRR
jgi:transcriptional regulator with XRE-family HTH domain